MGALLAVDDHALFGEENPQRGLIESITPAYSRFAVEGFVVAHLSQPFAGPKNTDEAVPGSLT
jgi:hypothetical protein